MADSKLQRNPVSEGDRKKRSSVTLTVVVIAVVVAAALAWFLVRNITTPPQLTAPSEQAVPVPSNNLDDSNQTGDLEKTEPPNTSGVEGHTTLVETEGTDGGKGLADDQQSELQVPPAETSASAEPTSNAVSNLAPSTSKGEPEQGDHTSSAEIKRTDGGKGPADNHESELQVPASGGNPAQNDAAATPIVRERLAKTPKDFIPPSFDVVTVTPAGDAVIAGRGEPNAEITIRDGETELGTVQTDSKGTWIFVPEVPLPPGVRELDLVTKTPEGVEVHSGEVVVLMLPSRNLPQEMAVDDKTPATPLAVLMSREGSGSAQLLQGKEPIHGLIAPESLTLDILNYEASGQVDFSGQGKPNSRISAYIDNELIGITTVMPDGTWQLVPTVQVALGLHTLRIDQIDLTGQVISRLETPFSMASFERPRTGEGLVIVQPGNSLWRIARRLYGQGIRYTMIFVANQDQIRDPALIYPGQIFIVPNEG